LTKKYKIPVLLFVLSKPKDANRKQLQNKEKLLSWKEITYLQNNGWTIGSHSATHRSFKNLSTAEIEKEIFMAKKTIERNIKVEVKAFAYPRGVVNAKVINAVKEAGYTYGFGIDANNVTRLTNGYDIPRTILDKTHTTNELPAAFTTTWLQIRRITNRFGLWEKLLK
jgi:peptidoglycan/xylan/chitin deacetylase (PgdA/CDA1 family)